MDTVDPEVLATAERAAGAVSGVRHVHVRARWLGRTLLVETEGFIEELVTVRESEAVGREVERAVLAALPEARAVTWAARAMPT